MRIKYIDKSDFDTVCLIYKQGIDTGIATFQTELPTWENWDERHLTYGRLGAFKKDHLRGWCTLSSVSSRCNYKGVAEVSVYVHKDFQHQGIGHILLNALIEESEQNGIWTLQSSIFTENNASIELHTKCGFRVVGTREKIGLLNGIWKDNLIMERRSKLIGI